MSHREPLVSVIVPAFNVARTLADTLQSVAAQSYANIEILIVDDGSADGTAEVAGSFCSKEPRARLLTKDNGGLPSARNFGIKAASGDWMAPVDADDLWHPSKIEKQVAAALAAPETPGFVYCWFRHIDESGRVIGSGPRVELQGRAFRQLVYVNAVGNGSSPLISRAALESVGLYDETLRACEDVEMQLRLAREWPIACVPEHLVGYRIHADNMSRDIDRIVQAWKLVYGRIAAQQPSIDPQVLRWVKGKSAYDDAEKKAVEGHYATALQSLVRALSLDPRRCGSLLLHRAARRSVRALGGGKPLVDTPRFYDVDPAAAPRNDPDAVPALAAFIDSLEQRRLHALGPRDHP